jgi:hypothetical protein
MLLPLLLLLLLLSRGCVALAPDSASFDLSSAAYRGSYTECISLTKTYTYKVFVSLICAVASQLNSALA